MLLRYGISVRGPSWAGDCTLCLLSFFTFWVTSWKSAREALTSRLVCFTTGFPGSPKGSFPQHTSVRSNPMHRLGVKVNTGPESPQQSNHANGEHRESGWPEEVSAIGTLVIAGLTFVYVCVTAGMLRRLKEDVAIARDTADAAKQNTKALIATQRAWITVEAIFAADLGTCGPDDPRLSKPRIVIDSSPQGGEEISADICLTCKNSGHTQGLVVGMRVNFRNLPEIPTTPDFSERSGDWAVEEFQPIAPDRDYTFGFHVGCDGPE